MAARATTAAMKQMSEPPLGDGTLPREIPDVPQHAYLL